MHYTVICKLWCCSCYAAQLFVITYKLTLLIFDSCALELKLFCNLNCIETDNILQKLNKNKN